MKDEVYVYASNLAARFVSEAQRTAVRWYDANPGTSEGVSGNAYAIPLWDRELRALPMAAAAHSIDQFLAYAEANPKTEFHVPRFTLGHRNIAEREIAKRFARAPANCRLPGVWERQSHPGLVKLFLVAHWAELSETDYELFYVWLHKYAKRLLAVPGRGGVWCVADARAQQHIGAWAGKEGVPFHALPLDRETYGQHAITMLHERLLGACTEILAMESRTAYVKAVLVRAQHLGLGVRLSKRYPDPAAAKPITAPEHAPTVRTSDANPLRQPTAEDLQIYDPAGVYGASAGNAPKRAPRPRSEVEDFPFGRILDYAPGAGA